MEAEIPQRITGRTELLGLIAYPIRHSQSPRMHNLALAKLGLDYAYLCFEIDDQELPAALDALRTLKVRGWNVSMPNKVPIVPLLDHVSPAVDMIGACNTVVNDNGVLTGHITDGIGYVEALADEGIAAEGLRLTQIGAGGVGTAIAVQCALSGAERIDLFNRRDPMWEKAEQTVATIRARTSTEVSLHDLDELEAFRESVAGADVLANTTNVGMGKLEGVSPLPDPSVLRSDLFVSEVVYSPLKTRFLEQADQAGCRFMNGIPLMLHQGAAAFKLWTGEDMPLDYVREHLFE